MKESSLGLNLVEGKMATIASNWSDLIDRILYIFPETERGALERIAGDRSAFVGYLSKQHNLTGTEAEDCVDMWLLLSPRNPRTLMMAAE